MSDPKAAEWLRTGALYGFVHVLATFACAVVGPRAGAAPPLFLGGVVVFSGALYAMAVGGPRWFGAIAPLGGLMFLGGWAMLAWATWRAGPQDVRDR